MFAVLPFTTAGKNCITLVFVLQLTGVKRFFHTPRKGIEKLNRRAKRMSALNMKSRAGRKGGGERERVCVCVCVCVHDVEMNIKNEGFRSFEYTTHSEKLRYFLPEYLRDAARSECGITHRQLRLNKEENMNMIFLKRKEKKYIQKLIPSL